MKASILYKIHENKDCETLQSIVRYMYAAKNLDIRPISIIERNMPLNIKQLPTLVFQNGYRLEGLSDIVTYYEKSTNILNLIENANTFNKLNSEYRITDNSTHRNIKFS